MSSLAQEVIGLHLALKYCLRHTRCTPARSGATKRGGGTKEKEVKEK
jgi:hypothetical protein